MEAAGDQEVRPGVPNGMSTSIPEKFRRLYKPPQKLYRVNLKLHLMQAPINLEMLIRADSEADAKSFAIFTHCRFVKEPSWSESEVILKDSGGRLIARVEGVEFISPMDEPTLIKYLNVSEVSDSVKSDIADFMGN